MRKRIAVLVACAASSLLAAGARADFVEPWDALTDDSWVYVVGISEPVMHTVNNGDYLVGFDRSKPNASGNEVASGMKALRFRYGGQTDGHLAGGVAGLVANLLCAVMRLAGPMRAHGVLFGLHQSAGFAVSYAVFGLIAGLAGAAAGLAPSMRSRRRAE